MGTGFWQECTRINLSFKLPFGKDFYQSLPACSRTKHKTPRYDAVHAWPSFVKGLPDAAMCFLQRAVTFRTNQGRFPAAKLMLVLWKGSQTPSHISCKSCNHPRHKHNSKDYDTHAHTRNNLVTFSSATFLSSVSDSSRKLRSSSEDFSLRVAREEFRWWSSVVSSPSFCRMAVSSTLWVSLTVASLSCSWVGIRNVVNVTFRGLCHHRNCPAVRHDWLWPATVSQLSRDEKYKEKDFWITVSSPWSLCCESHC